MPDDAPSRFAPDDPTPAKSRGGSAPAGKPTDWRAEPAAAAKGNRTALIAGTLFALLLIAGAVIGMIVFWPKPPAEPLFVSVPVGEYHDPSWPVNPWSRQDAEALAGCFPGRASTAYDSQERDRFRALLGRIAGTVHDGGTGQAGDGAKRPLVLHVTALAAVRDGKVYLLPGDARPADPGSWVPADEVLDAVEKSPAPHKLLLLDLAHPTADPFTGPLRDDAPAALDKLLKDRQKAGLKFWVLTSCAPDETSLPADPERCSGFAFYLAEGLRGAADGYQDGKPDAKDRDKRVTVRELARFTAARVARWARIAHDRRQTPQLYGPADEAKTDFPLTYHPLDRPGPANPPDPYPGWLVEGWQFRDKQRAAGADRGMPQALARLTAGLERAEEAWLRSGVDGRAEEAWRGAKIDWDLALKRSGRPNPADDVTARAADAVGKYRLVVAVDAARRRGRQPPPADWAPALRAYLQARIAAVPGKPDDSGKYREAWLQKVQADKAPGAALEAAGLVWEQAVATPAPTQEAVKVWAEAIDDLGLDKAYSEVLLLRSLAATRFGPLLAQYPKDAVAALLRAENESSRLLSRGPDGFDLIADRLKAAEDRRQAGQKDLLGQRDVSYEAVLRAEKELTEAAGLFAEIRKDLTLWQEAAQKLPGAIGTVLDTLPAALIGDQGGFEQWWKAAEATAALADQVAPAGRARALDPPGLTAAAQKVAAAVPPLGVRFAPPEVERLLKPAVPRSKPGESLPLEQLVAGPTLSGEQRKAVYDAIRSDGQRFHDDARKRDEADDAAGDQTQNTTAAPEQGRVREAEMAARRARASAALLRLAGSANADELGRLAADPAADDLALADRLRQAWEKDLPAQAHAAEAARPHGADRIAWVAPPGAARVATDDPPGKRQATAAAKAYKEWALAQLTDDKPYRSKAAGADEFYANAPLDLGPD